MNEERLKARERFDSAIENAMGTMSLQDLNPSAMKHVLDRAEKRQPIETEKFDALLATTRQSIAKQRIALILGKAFDPRSKGHIYTHVENPIVTALERNGVLTRTPPAPGKTTAYLINPEFKTMARMFFDEHKP